MSNISGWYYDVHQDWQGINRLTTVSLHANSYYKKADDWGYSPKTGAAATDEKMREPGTDSNRDDGGNPDYDEDGYYVEPICTCVLQEDFQITVQNQWTDMGEDNAGRFINSLRVNLAPFAGSITEGLKTMETKYEELSAKDKQELEGTVAGQILQPMISWLNKTVVGEGGESRLAKYLNSAILVEGSRFSIYQGSNINFNNMSMKFVVIPKWDPETGIFISVTDQLEDLYHYFFGEFVPIDKEVVSDTRLRSRITWQRPPAGYQADMSQLDATQKGSLKLKIGGNYSICNVVVEAAQLVFSKQMVKNPRVVHEKLMNPTGDVSGSDYLTPLSCEVTLSLRPCTRYSDRTLMNIVQGAGMNAEKKMISDKMIENLRKGMEEYASVGNEQGKGYLLPGVDSPNDNPKVNYNPMFIRNDLIIDNSPEPNTTTNAIEQDLAKDAYDPLQSMMDRINNQIDERTQIDSLKFGFENEGELDYGNGGVIA
jgi:hypothetical protein